MESSEIYRFNTSGNIMYQVMKTGFELSDENIYHNIAMDFDLLQKRLKKKNISYDKLKSALIPNQDKDRKEICFIFDTNKLEYGDYGNYIFSKLLPLLDKESTYSILYGDYINLINNENALFSMLRDTIICCNTLDYRCSNQFFIVYFNRLTQNQYTAIIDGLSGYSWFVGYVDATHQSLFKSYISNVICNLCVKNKNRVILPHPADSLDEENVNPQGYPYEENNFTYVSINEESFNLFLSYKIETEFMDTDDIRFSLNALFPKFDSFEKIVLRIDDDKWNKYLTDKVKGKGAILEKIGYSKEEKRRFIKEIYRKICQNYIYNLRKNEYGDLLFNVCVQLQTQDGNKRKTTIAIKYIPENGEMRIITVT
jgi:hypothetical protein